MKTVTQKYALKPIDSLIQHPQNPRQGDVESIRDSIEANGFYGAIVSQKSSGHILAGNHRLQAAIASGAERVPVIEIDCDDPTALKILLADNRTNDKASYDNDALVAILESLSSANDLDGTGYNQEDLDTLLRILESTGSNPIDAFDEWEGMPDFDQGDKTSTFRVSIHFKSSEDAEAFFTLINRPKKSSMWWPVDDEHVGSDEFQKYVAESE